MSDEYCGSCGLVLEHLPLNADVPECPDCMRGFCSLEHLSDHRELGTCPKHADGNDLAPTPPTEEPRGEIVLSAHTRAVLDAVAEVDRQWCANIDKCTGEDLASAVGATIAQLRSEVVRLRSDLNQATAVVEAAAAFCDQFAHRASGFPRRDALLAAVDAYRAYRSGQTEGTTPA